MEIKILGSGCKNCTTLVDNVRTALAEMEMEATVAKVTDFAEIAKYGVMQTPALVVNERVLSCGKPLKPKDIGALLKKAQKTQ